jgi:hypothetical protein
LVEAIVCAHGEGKGIVKYPRSDLAIAGRAVITPAGGLPDVIDSAVDGHENLLIFSLSAGNFRASGLY